LLWQANDEPCICDRNDLEQHRQLAAYAALNKRLMPLIFVPSLPWFSGWNEETVERWRERWEEAVVG
jgi:hypothetical protein